MRDKRLEIKGKLAADPGNRSLKKMREVKDDIAKTKIELMDEVDMELTNDERTVHKEAWFKHCKSSVSLKLNREKVYFLLQGQCTQVLLNMMEQGTDLVVISRLVDPHLLFKLIRNVVLKQSDNQYKPSVVDVAK